MPSARWIFLLIAVPFWAHAETCDYAGTTDYRGKITIETRYEIPSRFQSTLRTLLRFSASVLGMRIQYDLDEIDSLENEKLQSVALNTRYFVNGAASRQQWDRYDFHWRPNQTHALRISAKYQKDLETQFPAFAKYWDESTFGGDWLADYDSASPVRRPDLDLIGFSDGIQSMLYLAFIRDRFETVPNGSIRPIPFEPFIPGSKTGKPAPLTTSAPLSAEGFVVWSTPLEFSGLETPDNRPAQVTIDPATHLLEELRLTIQKGFISADGDLKLVGCR
ncbi:MAG: hypothetical protein P4M08_07580 [Oligoflexia bacterium]|nr:hypothetical protein [Oligoflexia bacterium]